MNKMFKISNTCTRKVLAKPEKNIADFVPKKFLKINTSEENSESTNKMFFYSEL